jgi:uncharacterized protein YceK
MKNKITILTLLLATTLPGCATYNSVETADRGDNLIFSGTRLDSCALTDNQVCLKTFNVAPSRYPLLDLPGSIVLDIVLLPYTLLYPVFY